MPLRNKYLEYENSKHIVFRRIANITLFINLIFMAISFRRLILLVSTSQQTQITKSVFLCHLYPLVASIAAIWVSQHKPKQEKGSLLGNEYLNYHLYYFKQVYFGVLVAAIIEIIELGLFPILNTRYLSIMFAVIQLVLAQTLERIWMKLIRARTAFS